MYSLSQGVYFHIDSIRFQRISSNNQDQDHILSENKTQGSNLSSSEVEIMLEVELIATKIVFVVNSR